MRRLSSRTGMVPWRRQFAIDKQGSDRAQSQRTPLFGASVGFGMDWVQNRAVNVAPQGVVRQDVPPPIKTRRHSNLLTPANLSRGYLDPSLTRVGKRTSDVTDQRVTRRGGSPVTRWDGKVRRTKRPSFKTSMPKSGPTHRDLLTQEMTKEPYSFF